VSPARAAGAGVTVDLDGFRNDRGQAYVLLFHSPGDGFPLKKRKAMRQLVAPVRGRRSRVVFTDLPPGLYAVAAMHDENRNNKMDTNWLGLPKEGWGMSNNPHPRFSPPSFRECAFGVAPPGRLVVLHMQY
jgi:uncharacterized protein (DUF2141 family)